MMQFVEDLKLLTSWDDEQLNDFIRFLNSTRLDTIAGSIALDKYFEVNEIDKDVGKKMTRFLIYITEKIVEDHIPERALAKLENDVIIGFKDDDAVISSWKKLKEIFKSLDGLIINTKEKYLNEKIANLESIALICDARPIFNVDKNKIMKYLYPVIVSISNTENNDDLILQTDEDGLIKIKCEVDMALQKLKILKAAVTNE